jgi:hypothetical protein
MQPEEGRLRMSSRLRVALSEFSEGRWATEPSIDPPLHPSELAPVPNARSSPGKRVSLALARLLITFGVGVAATLAWQSYGDTARGMIASSSSQLAWLAPQATPVAQLTALTPSATTSSDQLAALSRGLAVVRQSVDKLAAEITKLQATKPETSNKTSAPASVAGGGAPGRKPIPPAAPSQSSPVR